MPAARRNLRPRNTSTSMPCPPVAEDVAESATQVPSRRPESVAPL
jgi:hypothetical protein